MYVQRNNEARSCNHFCSGKTVSITYSESTFVVLGIQHAIRMRNIVIYGLPALQYASTLSHKRHDFRGKKVIEHKMCVLIFFYKFCLKVSHSMKTSTG
jgi:hypothetical protein